MTKGRVIGLGIGIVLIAATFSIVLWQAASQSTNNVAFAQGAATATPVAAPTNAPSTAPQQQTIGDTFWTLLAGKLGISADDLKKKALETRLEMIDAAVKDGRITQAQADALKQHITSNSIIAPIPLPRNAQDNPNNQNPNHQNPNNPHMPGHGFGPFNHPGNGNNHGKQNPAPFGKGFGMLPGRGMFGGGLQELEAVAKVLKLESKALIEQMAQGKSLAEIAKAQNVDEATVKKAILDARTAQIDQLLALGLISQVQAEQMKVRLTPDNIDLSRPLWFRFRMQQNAPGTSQLMPDFGMEQMFGDANLDMQMFGDAFEFAPDMTMPMDGLFGTDGALILPGDIQTQ